MWVGGSSMPAASDPTESVFKGMILEGEFSNKECLIRLRSLLPLQGVCASAWGRGGASAGGSALLRRRASPTRQVVCAKGTRRKGRGALRLRAQGTHWFTRGNWHIPKPGERQTRHRSSAAKGASGEPESAAGRAARNHRSL